MPPDPTKMAQLTALAQGGTAGLAQWQAANAATEQARSQAVAGAAGFGTGNYNPSAGSQAAAGTTANQYAAPGVTAVQAGLAAEPGLSALDTAAANTLQSKTNQSIQSKLAEARAKLDLDRQADEAERSTKLQQLALQREQTQFETANALEEINLRKSQLAMSPAAVAGEALKRQQETVAEAQAQQEDAQGGMLLNQIRKAWGEGQAQHYEREKATADQAAAAQQRLVETGEYRPEDAAYLKQMSSGAVGADSMLQRLAERRAQADAEINRFSQQGQQAASLGQLASLDLPRFQYLSAVDAGMDPNVAAGKYLTGEDEAIYQARLKEFNQGNLDETLAQREADRETKAAKQAQADEASELGAKIGWDPKDLVKTADQFNVALPDIAARVASDSWKRVDEFAKKAGEGGYKIDEADAVALGDATLKDSSLDEDVFWMWLQRQADLDPLSRQLAFRRYSSLFSPVPNNDLLEG